MYGTYNYPAYNLQFQLYQSTENDNMRNPSINPAINKSDTFQFTEKGLRQILKQSMKKYGKISSTISV